IYRRRGAQVLKQAGQKWRIVYTIPGLSGMTVAIEEGLGVTILARSTVPGSLQIIKNDSRFPDLGKIGIRLVSTQERQTEPVRRLKDYIRASLR
ncbi:MAG: LysR substrate-binding domain-containing protein, partial [Porticoccaceae bacterium]|nr:LysR substrate-binding domain-containing protein [Porticoccaceae bacterium]